MCVCESTDLPLWNKIDCTHFTRSHFKTLLNQVAEGWIPLNSLWSYCMLWSIALNPCRSSCGYQTLRFHGRSPEHNRLGVIWKPAGMFTSNLHLFYDFAIKETLGLPCSLAFFGNWIICSLLDWRRATWLDDDGAAASLLLLFAVTPGPQPTFGVRLYHNHPADHLSQQQVQLLHVVILQEHLPGSRTSAPPGIFVYIFALSFT